MSLLLWHAADDVGVTRVSDAQAAAAVVAAACSTKINVVCREASPQQYSISIALASTKRCSREVSRAKEVKQESGKTQHFTYFRRSGVRLSWKALRSTRSQTCVVQGSC